MKINKQNLLLFLLLFFTEIIIALYFHEGLIRTFIGDLLVVMLVFYFVRIFYQKHIFLAILGVFLFACVVELLQYLHIVELLQIENKMLKIIIGSVFDWKDIGAYAIGSVVLLLIHYKRGKQNLK